MSLLVPIKLFQFPSIQLLSSLLTQHVENDLEYELSINLYLFNLFHKLMNKGLHKVVPWLEKRFPARRVIHRLYFALGRVSSD